MTEKSSVFPIEAVAYAEHVAEFAYVFKTRSGQFVYVEEGRSVFTSYLEIALRYMIDFLAAYNRDMTCGRYFLFGNRALHIPVGEFDREGIGSKLMNLIAQEEKE